MEVNELRVGNFVWEEYGGLYEVININSEGFGYVDLRKPTFKCIGRYEIGSVKPIALTEEWLVKFGFEKDDTIWIKHPIYGLLEKNGRFFVELGETGGIYVKYIHQLQNLYFALTGEELKLK